MKQPSTLSLTGALWTHFQSWGKLYITSFLHPEHWRQIELSTFILGVLVLSCWQLGHCLLMSTPKGCAPGCVHLNDIVISSWNWMIFICAPSPWWSQRKPSSFGRSRMKWLRAQSITNLCVAEGWKSAWEKLRIFSNSILERWTLDIYSCKLETHSLANSFIWFRGST